MYMYSYSKKYFLVQTCMINIPILLSVLQLDFILLSVDKFAMVIA